MLDEAPDAAIEAADALAVRGELGADLRQVGKKRRDHNVCRVHRLLDVVGEPSSRVTKRVRAQRVVSLPSETVRVERAPGQEERWLPGHKVGATIGEPPVVTVPDEVLDGPHSGGSKSKGNR